MQNHQRINGVDYYISPIGDNKSCPMLQAHNALRNEIFTYGKYPQNGDKYDKHSIHITAVINQQVVGGGRIILGDKHNELPIESYLGKNVNGIFPSIRLEKDVIPAEIAGVFVSNNARGKGIAKNIQTIGFSISGANSNIDLVLLWAGKANYTPSLGAAKKSFPNDTILVTQMCNVNSGCAETKMIVVFQGKLRDIDQSPNQSPTSNVTDIKAEQLLSKECFAK